MESTDPTSASATNTTICNGDTTELTLNGGGGGSNESIQWYSGSCGGTNVGNGNGLKMFPATTTTYYGRYENGSSCAHNSACASVTITVNQKSSNPSSATASFPTICSGQSTTLTLNGGGGGTGETIKWYSGSCGGTLVGTGNNLVVDPVTTTTYWGRYEDGTPCNFNTACSSIEVTVNTTPTVTWPGTLESQCETATHYVLEGGTPPGGSYSGAGVTGALFNASIAGIGTHILTYSYTTAEGCTNTATNSISVYTRHKLSGNFTYYNLVNTPLDVNVTVALYESPGGSQVGSDYAISSPTGYYEFENICPGNYEVRATSTLPTDGSVNTTDAGQTNYWGVVPYTIEKTRFYAGDVTGNNYINSTDALGIQNHFVHGTAFSRSAWTFWRAGETISSNTSPEESYPVVTVPTSQDLEANFYGLCTGDFNRSFTPGLLKSASATLQLKYAGNMLADSNQVIELPVRIEKGSLIGALSLIMEYPANLVEVKDVVMNTANGRLDWAVNGNELRIGWNSRIPVEMADEAVLFTLRLRTTYDFTNEATIRLTLAADPLNELADDQFEVIPDAILLTEVIHASATGMEEKISSDGLKLNNFPNPFTNSTTITYFLPFDGKVTIEIRDPLGKTVKKLLQKDQCEGGYTLKFETGPLGPGIYMATIRLAGKNKDLCKTIKMAISR